MRGLNIDPKLSTGDGAMSFWETQVNRDRQFNLIIFGINVPKEPPDELEFKQSRFLSQHPRQG